MRISSIRNSGTGLGGGLGRARAAATCLPPALPPLPHHRRRRHPARAANNNNGNKPDDAAPPPQIIDPQAAQRRRDLEMQDDLLQHPERCSWYEARFAGDGQPDWHAASVVANEPACPSVGRGGSSSSSSGQQGPLSWRLITLAFEASRERVPLRNAYTEPGQTARVRSGPAMTEEAGLAVANPPPYEGEVLLPPVPRPRPTVVVAAARRRLRRREEAAAAAAALQADQTLLSATSSTAGSSGLEDDEEEEDEDTSAGAGAGATGGDDAFDFDAPWRESPYYASGDLPTPRQTDKALREALFRVRGDIFANEVKTVREPVSALAPLQLLVSPKASPELCAARAGDLVAVGPFEGQGLDLVRAGLLAVFRYRTIVLFVGGPDAAPAAIATARALLLSAAGRYPTSLLPAMRSGGVVVYYWAPNGASVCFGQEDFDAWGSTSTMAYYDEEGEEGEGEGGEAGEGSAARRGGGGKKKVSRRRANVRVVTTTRGFADAFDGDDDLVFDPDETAAIVLTGGDAAAEAAARQACLDAEIRAVVGDAPSEPRNEAPEYLSSVPKSFTRWADQSREMRAASAAREAAEIAEAEAAAAEAAAPGGGGEKQSASASSR